MQTSAYRPPSKPVHFFAEDDDSDEDLYDSDGSSDDPSSGDNFSGSASDEDFNFGSTPKISSMVHALNISYDDMNDYETEEDYVPHTPPFWFSNEAPGTQNFPPLYKIFS
jgi:hypothetical protein